MTTGKLILYGVLGAAGIVGVVYLAHKVLGEGAGGGGTDSPGGFGSLLVRANPKELPELGATKGRKGYNLEVERG